MSLADRSEAVAAALVAGDSCRALALARGLQTATIAAINRRRIPVAFQEQLSGSVNELVARVRCVPPRAGPVDDGNGKKKSKHREKHDKKEKDKD